MADGGGRGHGGGSEAGREATLACRPVISILERNVTDCELAALARDNAPREPIARAGSAVHIGRPWLREPRLPELRISCRGER
jgi:hypothetical protein